MVNNLPINFTIDSGSPVTVIAEGLFNKITPLERLKTTYKDVNNQKIDFTGQTKATVETNKETIEFPLLNTKTQTAPVMGLDWMQRPKINLSSNNDAIRNQNIKFDNTERRIIKLQNNSKVLLHIDKEKKLCRLK